MFQSRISTGWTEKFPCSDNLRISSWSYDMVGHAKKCVEWYCELANKTTQQLYKVSTPCIDDHHFKEEELKSVGELSNVCSQIVKNAYTWHVMDDLIFYGQWTNLHDPLQNGPKLVTNDYVIWHFTFLIQTVLLCGKYCQAMQAGTVSRLRFCRRSWGFKIYIRWYIVRFWKSYICSDQLDV